MGNKISIRSIWNVALSEFIKWITNPRLIILGVLLVFVRSYAVAPMLEHAEKYGEPLNVFEPFIAVGSSGILVLLMPILFLVLISDFPSMSESIVLFVHRTGKTNWFLGQILFVCMSIFTYIGIIFIGCMLVSEGKFGTQYSNAITQYDAAFPEEANGFVTELFPPNLYNQISILSALFLIIAVMALYLLALALILCMMKMLYLRVAGIFATMGLIAVGSAICALEAPLMWWFPPANSIIWLHYEEILAKPTMPLYYSFLYFIVIILILFIANIGVLRKLQFTNIGQEE